MKTISSPGVQEFYNTNYNDKNNQIDDGGEKCPMVLEDSLIHLIRGSSVLLLRLCFGSRFWVECWLFHLAM
jgi:hypothetical protein